MARIRSIKPSFFKSDDVSALPLRARLTWIGLWTQCDDQGRTKDHARLIKADIWPLDNVSLADIEDDLETLAAHGRIVRYEVDGRRFLEITNWSEHQKIDRPSKSTIPPPSTNGRRANDEDSTSPRAGKGREGRGKEGTRAREPPPAASGLGSEPPRKCQKHQDNPDPPSCGACRTAREANERWAADRRKRLDSAPRCRIHPGEIAANCRGCAAEAKGAA